MKVYIVTEGSYSDYHIKAVFTGKTQAEIYCAINEDCVIEEYETDEHKFDTSKEIKSVWVFEKGLDIFGCRYEHCWMKKGSFDDIERLNVQKFPRPLITLMKTLKKDIDEEKARKILQDRLALIVANGMEENCADHNH